MWALVSIETARRAAGSDAKLADLFIIFARKVAMGEIQINGRYGRNYGKDV